MYERGVAVEARWPPAAEDFDPNWPMESGADDIWYTATVLAAEGAGRRAKYELAYDDGGHARGIGAMHIREPVSAKRKSPSPCTPKKKGKKKAKRSKTVAAPNPAEPPRNPAIADQFWRYLHRRMCVRAEMYKETLTLLRGESAPKTFAQRPIAVPHDPILVRSTAAPYPACDRRLTRGRRFAGDREDGQHLPQTR